MVPAPPELNQVPGFSYLMNCAAHIWCWPTPAAKRVPSGGELADPLDDLLRGQAAVGRAGRSRAGRSCARRRAASTSRCSRPCGRPRGRPGRRRSGRRAPRGRRRRSARPRRGSWRSRPGRCRRARSWRSGAKVSSWPVTRSSKRAPSAMIRSDFCSAVTAETSPCMPGMPTCCGWLSGKAPSAISVVVTGAPVSSARMRSSAVALRLEHAAADVEHRAAGLVDQPGGLADLLGVRLGHRAVAGQVLLRRPGERGLGLQGVLGDVDQDRAGAAGGGDVERLGDGARDVGRRR